MAVRETHGDWDAALYDAQHAFVWQRGADVLPLLAPQRGEHILDLGCGTGHLTARIAESGAEVTGLDSSRAMIEQARQLYPNLRFVVGDAADFRLSEPFDAVFSNAALHWVRQPERVAACVWSALRPGGRFVAELGGRGNIRRILEALERAWPANARESFDARNPWYYPSVGEYATLLEDAGFRVTFAAHFDRPTPLEEGEEAMRAWLRQFTGAFLEAIPESEQEGYLQQVEQRLRLHLYRERRWSVDYVRLRVAALRPEESGA